MFDKKKVQPRLRNVLKQLFEGGVRSESIAVRLSVSNASVLNWAAGRRCPKRLFIEKLEELFHVRILNA